MRSFILSLLAFTLAFNLQAQECATDLLPRPKIMGLNRVDVNLDDVDIVTLPIVFHIMHTGQAIGEGANITDDQIVEMLGEANQMFRKVPGSVGDGEGVDTKIDFCLAQRDPDGNPTTGVTRHDLSGFPVYVEDGVASSSIQDGMNDEQMKEIACWDVDKYVNVYIVTEIGGNNGGGGIQGYAYLGPTNDCRDGVVMLANKMVVTEFNLGKTFVHELGHYLTIDHTFVNTFSCTQETNCETQGDRICDTPPTTTNNFCSLPDCPDALTENYMDYTGEQCRNMYTTGQAEKMHECLLDDRYDLWNNNFACIPPVDYDAAVSNVDYNTPFCLPEQDVTVTVTGVGPATIPVATVTLTSDAGSYDYMLHDIAYGQSYEALFEGVTLQGDFSVTLFSGNDEYAGNDTIYGSVVYEPGALWEMDFTSDFFAAETDWVLLPQGSKTPVIEDGNWPSGITTRSYETCLPNGCYNFVITDLGGDGIPWGGELSMWVNGEPLDIDISGPWNEFVFEFCVESESVNNCPADLDDDGVVGVEDVAILINDFDCAGDCVGDLDGSGIVNVLDLLEFLIYFGEEDCIVTSEASLQVSSITELADQGTISAGDNNAGPPVYYDMSGRVVPGPVENLSPGIYIVKCARETKKIFVQ